jgi:hypothetical protein
MAIAPSAATCLGVPMPCTNVPTWSRLSGGHCGHQTFCVYSTVQKLNVPPFFESATLPPCFSVVGFQEDKFATLAGAIVDDSKPRGILLMVTQFREVLLSTTREHRLVGRTGKDADRDVPFWFSGGQDCRRGRYHHRRRALL